MEKTAIVYKASGIGDIPDLFIQAIRPIKETETLAEHEELLIQQGKILYEALVETLPQGTLDALLCELLERKRSRLSIRLSK